MLYTVGMKILLFVAMGTEASPIFNKSKHRVSLITGGADAAFGVDKVGTQNAAVSTTLGINSYRPDLVINVGTAGGFKAANANIGDVYIADNYVYHDRRIPLPGFDSYGVGGYQMQLPELLTDLFTPATITTGNSLDTTKDELRIMLELAKTAPLVKDMEAAAIAEVCTRAKVPLISLKAITDLVDGGQATGDEFIGNLALASSKLQAAVSNLLDHLTPELVKQIAIGYNPDLIAQILALRQGRASQ